jgi:T4-like virus Myoviridae tail sheath stabiliser
VSQFFYDGQIKRYLTQFMRLMSNFCIQDANGNVKQVPVRYGDMSRQVAAIINKNSENIVPTAPFISCYIKDVKFNRAMMQDPTFVSKVNIRERDFDTVNNQYLNTQGGNYTVERLMPTPYQITFNADIWTTNTDQKFQLWEQITVLFNPSMELQSNDNYVDWTSLTVLELTDGCVFDSRQIPQGTENNISISTLQFNAPIWITPPAKVKKLGIITKIISNIFSEPTGSGEQGVYLDALYGGNIFGGGTPDARVTVTLKDYGLLVLNNTAVLVPVLEHNVSDGWVSVEEVPGRPSWLSILDRYPGKFTPGLSQIRLGKPGGNEIVATIALNPLSDHLMSLTFDRDTIPSNTNIAGRTNVDAIINPETFNPLNAIAGTRYLILENINVVPEYGTPGYSGPAAWKNSDGSNFQAYANDIIEWNGTSWSVVFNSQTNTAITYITNAYTGIQYKWDGQQWSKSFEGLYENINWRLVL